MINRLNIRVFILLLLNVFCSNKFTTLEKITYVDCQAEQSYIFNDLINSEKMDFSDEYLKKCYDYEGATFIEVTSKKNSEVGFQIWLKDDNKVLDFKTTGFISGFPRTNQHAAKKGESVDQNKKDLIKSKINSDMKYFYPNPIYINQILKIDDIYEIHFTVDSPDYMESEQKKHGGIIFWHNHGFIVMDSELNYLRYWSYQNGKYIRNKFQKSY